MKEQKLKVVESIEEWNPQYLDIVAVIFVSAVLISNIAAQKLFAFGQAVFTAGILIFPISYIFGDVLTEVYGFNKARRVIYLGLLANIFLAIFLWIAIKLPPAPGWPFQKEFATILGFVPRIVIASITGYVAGEIVNSIVMSKLKIKTVGKHLWIRTISSTFIGQFVDTAVFALIAFIGIIPKNTLVIAIFSGWIFKVVYEASATPLTYIIVNCLKKLEGIEHFDKKDKIRLF